MTGRLYEGLKVLDFSTNIAGPIAASMLADFGAEVIKVERPVCGEDTRMAAPQLEGFSYCSWYLNRGKKSITLSLRDPEAIAFIKEKLIPEMDVLIEGFRPGTMTSMGLGYEDVKAIKPYIIYCSISMYGQTGRDSRKPGYDMLAQARSGLLDVSGEKGGMPVKSGFYISDYVASTYSYAGIASALYYREKTGIGQWLDIALLDAIFSYNSNFENAELGIYATRVGNHAQNVAPYGVFEGSNHEYIALVAQYNQIWTKLCRLMGRPELVTAEGFDSPDSRVANLDNVVNVIETWLKTFPDVREAVKLIEAEDIPVSLIYNIDDIHKDEHLKSRGMIVDIESPTPIKTIDKVASRGIVIHMSETPGKMNKAPAIGEHNHQVMEQYGMPASQVDRLQKKWADEYWAKKGRTGGHS